MGITSYEMETAQGKRQIHYLVVAEGINKYTGKRVQKKRRGITSKVKAETVYKELWCECREGKPDGPPVKTWGELKAKYFEDLEKNVRSPENINGISPQVIVTKKGRFFHLEHWDEKHLELMTGTFVKNELDALEKRGTISRSLAVDVQKATSAIFTYAVQSKVLDANPLFGMKRKRPKKRRIALGHEEANRLLYEAKARKHPYYIVWLLSLAGGMRRSELAGLKWTDINFEAGLAFLCRQVQPKEGLVEKLKDNEDRVMAIPKYVIPELKEYRLRSTSEYVIDLDCYQWKHGHQAKVIRDFCREIGIKEVTHHSLRSSFISLALQDGVATAHVKDNVGHSKLSTTDGYYNETGIHLSGVMDRLQIKVPTGKAAEVIALKGAK